MQIVGEGGKATNLSIGLWYLVSSSVSFGWSFITRVNTLASVPVAGRRSGSAGKCGDLPYRDPEVPPFPFS